VHIYRDDGTTLTTSTAAVDLKAGAAAGADMVHAEGPFGTLDAQGFALIDKGAVIQFSGPGRLILNSAQHQPAAPHDAAPVREGAADAAFEVGEAPRPANVAGIEPTTSAGPRGAEP